MTNAALTVATFVVRFVTVVDRPALRGSTFAPVAAGTTVVQYDRFTSQSAAVAAMERILRGEYDYVSEYVSKVEVYQVRANRSPRTVRKLVERRELGARRAMTSIVNDAELRYIALAVAADRRGNRMRAIAA